MSTLHLTSLYDSSSNVALVKMIYQAMPVDLFQKVLRSELLHDLNEKFLPHLMEQLPEIPATINPRIAEKVHMSAVLFGLTYGNRFQEAWIEYLVGNINPSALVENDAITIDKNATSFIITVQKETKTSWIYSTVLIGAFTGLARNMRIPAPKVINDTEEKVFIQIKF